MILNDFVMLGTSVPEPSAHDGRTFVCSAGWSNELNQFVRIYPLALRSAPRRWSVNVIELERNPKDSRFESWKIAGDRSPEAHMNINERFKYIGELTGKERDDIVRKGLRPSKEYCNERRESLAIVVPLDPPKIDFRKGTEEDEATFDIYARSLTEPVKKRFAWHPRLKFTDEGGKHDLAIRDWGCYELLRNQGSDYMRDHLHKALGLHNNPPLFLGNMVRHRNVWMVISILTGRKPAGQASLF